MRGSRVKRTGGVDGGDVPLVVDVDGTLVAGDLLIEGLLRLFRKSPLKALWLSFRLFGVGRGRAALKRRLAVAMPVEPETLVLHAEVEEKVASALRSGRPVWLASGSDELLVRPLAKFIGADGYLASDGKTNLVGLEKARALVERFGLSGFDYIGNERRDLVVWEQARRAVGVDLSALTVKKLRGLGQEPLLLSSSSGGWREWVRTMRPHQWTKNLLVFVPILAAHVDDVEAYLVTAGVFVALSCCASGTYVFNDLLDLPHDRQHPDKRDRPIAAGRVPVPWAAAGGMLLVACGLLGAYWLSESAGLWLAVYVVGTVGYSLWLKRLVVVDVIALALLYGVRIEMGATESVATSPWLLFFSLFVFMTLAVVKRQSELMGDVAVDAPSGSGRGYVVGDAAVMTALGAGSAFASVVVLALYVQSSEIMVRYGRPELLGFVCPLLIYWLGRLLLLANRGVVHHDPIVFAMRDRVSWFVALASGAVVVTAMLGA